MYVKHVQAAPESLRDPEADVWAQVPSETVDLAGTPLEAQPNRYIRNSLKTKTWGACKAVQVQAAHDGANVYFRLEWSDSTDNRHHEEELFPDAAALLFPMNGEATLETMGSPEHPVNAWFWRPDIESTPENLVAKGIGTVERQDADQIAARSGRGSDSWRLVIARALSNGHSQSGVELKPGGKSSIAVAIWDGSSGERAGIKAFSQRWRDLELEG